MNQIPRGEFCGDCPCAAVDCCALYDILWEQDVPEGKRLSICLKERPQIVKGKKRFGLITVTGQLSKTEKCNVVIV